ncbi:MAG: sugar phosphate isomerase/epimerase [Planctomycetes bacterium]|nr:sugar phosphate isomerase/epimerase [Planctomycetota bacterium]
MITSLFTPLHRRQFCRLVSGGIATCAFGESLLAKGVEDFQLRYVLGSCMYGTTPLAEILPEVAKIGANAIDIWPRVHGNQREQIEEMGHEAFAALLQQHNVRLGILTRYDLGPLGLESELAFAKRFGARMIVTGSKGPKGLTGTELKSAVRTFVDQMQPHIAAAEEHGVTIAIENHGNAVIDSPDSIRWMAEMAGPRPFGIALAPYHLPQDSAQIAGLIRDLGDRMIHFYAWEHGRGCFEKLPKEQELMQMPGRGTLDFVPILAALKAINYRGWTEVFMHPVPRGVPILDTTAQVTAEINRARGHLAECLRRA